MTSLVLLLAVSAGLGLFLGPLVIFGRRFGAASKHLGAFAFCCAFSALSLCLAELGWSTREESSIIALGAVLVAAAAGHAFAALLESNAEAGTRTWAAGARHLLYAVACAVASWLAASHEDLLDPGLDVDLVPLGIPGFVAGIFLLSVSVLALVHLEKTMRRAEEHVRWAIKLVVLGVYLTLATFIYLASRMLLYSVEECALPQGALRVCPSVFGVSAVLVLASWRRLAGASVVVSQRVAYGSITMVGVGLYLIISSLASRWIGARLPLGLESQAFIFVLCLLLLAMVFLSTRVQHRLRHWIRRNFFSGRYDYRTTWLEAAEHVRSNDSPEELLSSFADLVVRAIDALDLAIWIRVPGEGTLKLMVVRGCDAGPPRGELSGVLELLAGRHDPIPIADAGRPLLEAIGKETLETTKAALLVPLESGEEALGLLAVGPDRSGRPYQSEAADFLRVLATHASSEYHNSLLLASRVAAKEAEAFRSFALFLLHDLKNFASTLSLVAKNAVKHYNNPEFQRDAFQSVLDTSEKMKRICNSLRTFTGALALKLSPRSLNEVVQEAVKQFDGALSARLRLVLSPVPTVLLDSEEVGRLLQNLVLNAAEASSSTSEILIETRASDRGAELSVVDSGTGIPREFLEASLFQPFKTTKSTGLGIGLFQSKKILEAHGGSIRVESVVGKGTTVVALFPAGERAPVLPGAEASATSLPEEAAK